MYITGESNSSAISHINLGMKHSHEIFDSSDFSVSVGMWHKVRDDFG